MTFSQCSIKGKVKNTVIGIHFISIFSLFLFLFSCIPLIHPSSFPFTLSLSLPSLTLYPSLIFPRSLTLYPSLIFPRSLTLSYSLTLAFSLSLSFCLSLCLCLPLFISLSLSLSLSKSHSLSHPLCISHSLFLSIIFSLSLSLPIYQYSYSSIDYCIYPCIYIIV